MTDRLSEIKKRTVPVKIYPGPCAYCGKYIRSKKLWCNIECQNIWVVLRELSDKYWRDKWESGKAAKLAGKHVLDSRGWEKYSPTLMNMNTSLFR